MPTMRRFLSGKRLAYGFFLLVLLLVIVASFSPGIVSQVTDWLQRRSANLTPTLSGTASSLSTLIPHAPLVFNDPLTNSHNPYQWDTGPEGGATCFFVADLGFHIIAPARSLGGGCGPEAPKTIFTNFVYQIKMIVVQGSSKELAAGIYFCGTVAVLGGSFYSIDFNTQGDWNFSILTGGSTGPAKSVSLLAGQSQYFQTGIGQVNYITVRATKDHQITAQINGKALFQTRDQRLSGGQIGVGISNGGAQSADALFTDARVWQL